LPPLVIIKAGDRRLPVWPEPPKINNSELPVFCPPEHRATIKDKFVIHLHQHPEIPFDDKNGTYLTADEIYEGAVSDMYHYCVKHGLTQVWAYMWNCWYSPKQWPLWARAASPEIPRLKATMISESQWKVIKHQDLGMFNRPRLDLVTHIIITSLVPCLRVKLANLLGTRRQGRTPTLAEWQKDFRHEWDELSKPDELRHIQKELEWLYKPKNTKGRAERLTLIQENATRKPGKHHTDTRKWVCSCPAYLISRFLLCKHLVRIANERMKYKSHTHIDWFATLRRNHLPPYYHIPGIHDDLRAENEAPVTLRVQQPRLVLRTLADAIIADPLQLEGNQPGSNEEADETSARVVDEIAGDNSRLAEGQGDPQMNDVVTDVDSDHHDFELEGAQDSEPDMVLTESDDAPNEHAVGTLLIVEYDKLILSHYRSSSMKLTSPC
jgi:hypothetical protein